MTPATLSAPTSGAARWKPTQEQIVLIVTALLAVGFAFTLDGFATLGNLLTLTRGVAILGILGIAMSVVVIGRGLDLSLVATMAVSSAFALQLMQHGWAWPAAVAAAALSAGRLRLPFFEMSATHLSGSQKHSWLTSPRNY